MKWWERAWLSCPSCFRASTKVQRTGIMTVYHYPCGTSVFMPVAHARQPKLYAIALLLVSYFMFLGALMTYRWGEALFGLVFFVGVIVILRRMGNEA